MILPHQNVYPEVNHCILVGGLDDCLFLHIVGFSQSQLTFMFIFFRGWLNHQPVYHHVTIYVSIPFYLPETGEVSSATGSFRHSVGIGFPGSLPNRCSVMDEVRCKGSHDHYEWKSGKRKEK